MVWLLPMINLDTAAFDGVPVSLVQVGPWGLLIIVVGLVFRGFLKGDLVSRKNHEDILHDRDMWRAAHMTSEAARQEERDQKRELLEHARVTAAVMNALPKPPPEEHS